MKDFSIKTKTTLIIMLIVVLISIINAYLAIQSIEKFSKYEIKQSTAKEYAVKKQSIKNYVQMAIDLIKKQDRSKNPLKRQIALKEISHLRFGKSGYFWINNTKNIMLSHPEARLVGKDVSNVKTANGIKIFTKLTNRAIKSKNGAYVNYLWQKIGYKNPIKKVSFVEVYKPWGWVVGSGAYLDGIQADTAKVIKATSAKINEIILKIGISTIVILILVYFIINFVFKRFVSNPLKEFGDKFQHFLSFISMQENKYEPSKIKANNEITKMLLMLNNTAIDYDKRLKDDMKVVGETVLVGARIEQGIFQGGIKAESKNPMFVALRKSINRMLDFLNAHMQDIKITLESYNKDDYTKSIPEDDKIKADMKAVIDSVNMLGKSLALNAKTNLNNGTSLEKSSSTMTNSMHTLSSKANEQAARLEETAAAIEEITSLTRNNRENTSKMANLGEDVKGFVENGQKLANKTAVSMEEINTKITSISDATNTIDQISFQTNILSLNAAVEAATAGEAGKGFAVVAGEVRSLASRSAEAAKQIKELVKDAKTKADEGQDISGVMIEEYKSLSENMAKTINLIEDINVASKEQMTGVEQINDAITTQDQITQQNANESAKISQIASEVTDMANELVANAKNKKF